MLPASWLTGGASYRILQNRYTIECFVPRNLLINLAFPLRKVSYESKEGFSAKPQSSQQALKSLG